MNFTRGCSNTLTILIKKNDSTTFLHYFFTQVLLINYVKCIQKQTNKNITQTWVFTTFAKTLKIELRCIFSPWIICPCLYKVLYMTLHVRARTKP